MKKIIGLGLAATLFLSLSPITSAASFDNEPEVVTGVGELEANPGDTHSIITPFSSVPIQYTNFRGYDDYQTTFELVPSNGESFNINVVNNGSTDIILTLSGGLSTTQKIPAGEQRTISGYSTRQTKYTVVVSNTYGAYMNFIIQARQFDA
ncbi:hypothetical protein [Paenibacillus sp. F4]|uniref:hypothetical protein n=1 Tax=Paenibacillus sp. F4 TaxID=357385 RepID=UPI000C9EF04C|nr:hypothetical protein [Paenibacillus sp. F4]PNQ79744.1 hypothetical protein C1T21_17270 [Paenibacillus sp. F4]